ncbi:MAG: hypothetical protein H7232_01480 [Aeromicrobium sp.]|nr:hypothetical protein [Burkholderiales bacterium]
MNVIYGASDTGKSFIVEVIDFMLGGGKDLVDFEERKGYNQVLLGIATADGRNFTLQRAIVGGGLKLYDGLIKLVPADDVEHRVLSPVHRTGDDNTVSTFLLGLCGILGKRIRKNARGETISLSFRNLARLSVVDEDEIKARRSPLADDVPQNLLANVSAFKLLLSGVDDSALVPIPKRGPADFSRDGQAQLLREMVDSQRKQLRSLTKEPAELDNQIEKLDYALVEQKKLLASTEARFQVEAAKRRELRRTLETSKERRSEIGSLLARFGLLARHYASDIERLRAVEEGGTLFNVLGPKDCPLCGASPSHQNGNAECIGNVESVVTAARCEIAKIKLLVEELASTVRQLTREGIRWDKRIPEIERDLAQIDGVVTEQISPDLSRLRTAYSDLADTRSAARTAKAMYTNLLGLEQRASTLAKEAEPKAVGGGIDDSSKSILVDEFAQEVQSILIAWAFPKGDRVQFDHKRQDLLISGKQRQAFGQGLRAITRAAFTIALLVFCRQRQTPHTGFVVLDSPLLAYREAESEDDSLKGSGLQERYYEYLTGLGAASQVIIVENTDPPDSVRLGSSTQFFSGNSKGRYGLFPSAK